jgi:hypothetical protein
MKTINFNTHHNREKQKFIYRFEEKINRGSIKWKVLINQFRTKSLHRSNLSVILYFTGLVLLCESCAFTWIGRSVGADIGKPHFNDYSDTRIIKVTPERINYGGRNHVEVHKTDNSVLTGIFKGFTTVPSEKYNPDYNLPAVDSASRIANPDSPGELLLASISTDSGFSIEVSYPYRIGFKNRNSSYALSPDQFTNLFNSKATENQMKKSGNVIEPITIPLRKGVIILDDKNQKVIIPVEEIAYARCQRGERYGKLIGAAIGAIFDIAAVVLKSKDNITVFKSMIDF